MLPPGSFPAPPLRPLHNRLRRFPPSGYGRPPGENDALPGGELRQCRLLVGDGQRVLRGVRRIRQRGVSALDHHHPGEEEPRMDMPNVLYLTPPVQSVSE